jgi:transposase InsO family protein
LILSLLTEATDAGARLEKACEMIDLSVRTAQRWRSQEIGEDRRRGPLTPPANKLSPEEREEILEVVNLPEYRDLPPTQIVPRLADEGTYLASESTIYRILREERQLVHREPSKPATRHRPREHVATGPDQVYSWDITYLLSPVRGRFYYLYMVIDVWSRKIVGFAVHDRESAELAAELVQEVSILREIDPEGIVLHSDNGGPMKGSTMLATLQRLGVVPSFSRPGVSNDNPFSESLFRTMKYRPEYPAGRFGSLEQARAWVALFVRWYNTEHLHSGINFVTPEDRHAGREREIFAGRRQVYTAARRRHPERWSGEIRRWESVKTVRLNPEQDAERIGQERKVA